MSVRDRSADADDDDQSGKKKRKEKEKLPPLTVAERRQRWNVIKEMEMPRVTHPTNGGDLLAKAEKVKDRYTLSDDGLSITCKFGKPLSDGQIRDQGNIRSLFATVKWKKLYARYLMDENAGPGATHVIEAGGRRTHVPVSVQVHNHASLGKFFLHMILFAGLAFAIWNKLRPFLAKIIPGVHALPQRGQELKDKFIAGVAEDVRSAAVDHFRKGRVSIIFDETTNDNCESVFAMVAVRHAGRALMLLDFLRENSALCYIDSFSMITKESSSWAPVVGGTRLINVLAMSLDSGSAGIKFVKSVATGAPHILMLFDRIHLADHVLAACFSLPFFASLLSIWRRWLTAIAKERRRQYSDFFNRNRARLPTILVEVNGSMVEKTLTPKYPPSVSDVRWLSKYDSLVHHTQRYELEKEFILHQCQLHNVGKLNPEEDDEEKKGFAKLADDAAAFYHESHDASNKLILDVGSQMIAPLVSFMTRFQVRTKPQFHLIFRDGEHVKAHFKLISKGLSKGRRTDHWDRMPDFVRLPLEEAQQKNSGSYKVALAVLKECANKLATEWKMYWEDGATYVPREMNEQQVDAMSFARVFDPRQKNEEVFKFEDLVEIFTWPRYQPDLEQLEREYELYLKEPLPDFGESWEIASFWEGRLAMKHLPLLAEFALDVIWLPTSSAEVERFFSAYNDNVDPSRLSLTHEAQKQIMPVYYDDF